MKTCGRFTNTNEWITVKPCDFGVVHVLKYRKQTYRKIESFVMIISICDDPLSFDLKDERWNSKIFQRNLIDSVQEIALQFHPLTLQQVLTRFEKIKLTETHKNQLPTRSNLPRITFRLYLSVGRLDKPITTSDRGREWSYELLKFML